MLSSKTIQSIRLANSYSELAKTKGFSNLDKLCNRIKNLPYKRISDSENLNWSFETRIIFRPTERLPLALEEPLATDSPTQESEQ